MVDRIKRVVTRQAKNRDREVELFVLRLEKFLGRNLRRILKRLDKVEPTAVEYAKAVADLEDQMREAGLDEQMDGIRDLFGEELDRVDELFRETTRLSAPPLTVFDRKNIEALVDERVYAATKSIEKYLGDARTVIVNSAFGEGIGKLDEVAEALGSRAFSNLQTDLTTSMMGYTRLVNDMKAEEAGLDLFLYVGPDDKVTREFCHERVGKVWTREQIDSWDAELVELKQPTPAFIYLGGYNCRHHLQPVSEELVAELGLERGDG